jgi:hypothetical protein
MIWILTDRLAIVWRHFVLDMHLIKNVYISSGRIGERTVFARFLIALVLTMMAIYASIWIYVFGGRLGLRSIPVPLGDKMIKYYFGTGRKI